MQRPASLAAGKPMIPTPAWRRALRQKLAKWYQRHRRDLPWRRSRDPYCVWISEIMLQQTQVVTVIPYYERFIESFPDVATLAEADEQEVLRHWEGLGYYRRARQLHRAAGQVMGEHGGEFPNQLDDVLRLAGIGRYTAGAITSIAFDLRAPILEANTLRLYSRLIGYKGDVTSRTGQELLWQFAEVILPRRGSGEINQALMELGSRVCTPRAPDCDACPLNELCAARRSGRPEDFPARRRKPAITAVSEGAVIAWRGGRVLIRQHAPGERWAGLWDFLRFPLENEGGLEPPELLAQEVHRLVGLKIALRAHLGTIRHGVTRFRITLDCHEARVVGGRLRSATEAPLRWVEPAELTQYPLSMTARKIAGLLAKRMRA